MTTVTTFETKHMSFYYILELEILTGMKAMREKLNIHVSAADLLHIRIGNLDWCECGHRKN